MSFDIMAAGPEYRAALSVLLQQTGLHHEDLPADIAHFLVALDDEGKVIGSAGWELYGPTGLFRSFAVAPEHRKGGLGQRLYQAAMDHARSQGIREAWLITISAADYFSKRGFERVDRASAPHPIQHTVQFSELCPASAVLMKRSL